MLQAHQLLSYGKSAPLYLDEARVRALERLWMQHGVATEVTRRRNAAERVIRDAYY